MNQKLFRSNMTPHAQIRATWTKRSSSIVELAAGSKIGQAKLWRCADFGRANSSRSSAIGMAGPSWAMKFTAVAIEKYFTPQSAASQ